MKRLKRHDVLRHRFRWVAAVGAILLLTGCSSTEMVDLREEVDQIKASRKGRVEPLPEFTPPTGYTYAAANFDDPFVSWQDRLAAQAEQARPNSGLQPDLRRRREPLESYPLDTLRMVGTMEREQEHSALVKSPDGVVSRIQTGNFLGQNHGRVISIREDRIELIEIVPDGDSGWIERPASLALYE